ncbi:hypothetical protein [Mycolicibacterium sp. HS_4_1]
MTLKAVAAAGLLWLGAMVPVASAGPALPEVPSPPGTTFVDDPAIIDTHPLAAESWSRLDPAPELALNFQMGSPDCYGVHATVHETDDAVLVSLVAGHRRPGPMVCTMIMMQGRLVVPLGNPVGDRAVLPAD